MYKGKRFFWNRSSSSSRPKFKKAVRRVQPYLDFIRTLFQIAVATKMLGLW